MFPCAIDDCKNFAKYCIEWYGENQFHKNPIVVDEIEVCESHLVEFSVHPDYGGVPDNIYDVVDLKDRPDVLEEVVKKLK